MESNILDDANFTLASNTPVETTPKEKEPQKVLPEQPNA